MNGATERYTAPYGTPTTVCASRVSGNVYLMALMTTESLSVISVASWPPGESSTSLLTGIIHVMTLFCRWYIDEDFGGAGGGPQDDPNEHSESVSSDESY